MTPKPKKKEKWEKEQNFILKHLMNQWNVPDLQADKLIFEVLKITQQTIDQREKEIVEETVEKINRKFEGKETTPKEIATFINSLTKK